MKHKYEPLASEDDVNILPSITDELLFHFRLAGPLMFTHLMDYLPGVTTVFLVGQLQTKDKDLNISAATTSTTFLNMTSMAVGIGLCSAVGILCSHAHGAKNTKLFNAYIQSASLGMTMTLIPMFIMNWNAGPILRLSGQSAEIAEKAAKFTELSSYGLPFFFAFEIFRKVLQAHSSVDFVAIVSLISNFIHIGLGYYLVHYTTWGFYGAAIARSISNFCLILFIWPYFYFNPIYVKWGLQPNFSIAKKHLGEFFCFGIPGMVMMWVEFGSFGVLSILADRLPQQFVQSRVGTVLAHLLSMLYMLYLGISSATMVRIGNMLGAEAPRRARYIMHVSYLLVMICLAFTITGIILTRDIVSKSFFPHHDVVKIAREAILFILPLHVFNSFNANTQGVYRGIGKPSIGAVVNAGSVSLLGFPTAAIVGIWYNQGIIGLWTGFTIGSTIAFTIFIFLLRRINWEVLAIDANARS